MFAIAVWARPRRRLWLARDRLGVKPLYYSPSAGRFAFASEIKALRALDGVGVRANPRAIAQYLEHGYPIDQETWFAGVERLAPGCTVTVEPGSQPRRAAYWDPIDRFREPVNGIDAPARVRELLADSVRIRLRSDVPVGAHLSGGMDSSSLVALMAQQGRDSEIHTFSGAFAEGPGNDERRYVRLVTEPSGEAHPQEVPTAGAGPT